VYGWATSAGVGVESTKVGKSERTAEETTQRAALLACVRPNKKGELNLNAAPLGVSSIETVQVPASVGGPGGPAGPPAWSPA